MTAIPVQQGKITSNKLIVAGLLLYMLAPIGMTLTPLMVGAAANDLGLSDAEESVQGTDPLNGDSEGDGWSGKEEVDAGTNPLQASSHPVKNPINLNIGAETGTVDSGLPVPLVESYSNSTTGSDVEDANGNKYIANEIHAMTAEWAAE